MYLDFEQPFPIQFVGRELLIPLEFLLQPLYLNGQVIDDAPVVIGSAAIVG
jgi:hypothetical protein